MIAFAKKSNRWYVAIARQTDDIHYKWDAGSEENFEFYEESMAIHGYEIIAKETGLSDSDMDRITGYNIKQKKKQNSKNKE